MFSICFASFIFIMTSSISSMPISGTHAVVGGVLGSGLAITSASNLNVRELLNIAIQWIASPCLSMAISFTLMTIVSWLTLRTDKLSYGARIFNLQLISAFSYLVIAEMVWNMIKHKLSNPSLYIHILLLDLNALIIGFFSCRLILLIAPKKLLSNGEKKLLDGSDDRGWNISTFFFLWKTKDIEVLT